MNTARASAASPGYSGGGIRDSPARMRRCQSGHEVVQVIAQSIQPFANLSLSWSDSLLRQTISAFLRRIYRIFFFLPSRFWVSLLKGHQGSRNNHVRIIHISTPVFAFFSPFTSPARSAAYSGNPCFDAFLSIDSAFFSHILYILPSFFYAAFPIGAGGGVGHKRFTSLRNRASPNRIVLLFFLVVSIQLHQDSLLTIEKLFQDHINGAPIHYAHMCFFPA